MGRKQILGLCPKWVESGHKPHGPNGALERFQLEGNAGEQVSAERIVELGKGVSVAHRASAHALQVVAETCYDRGFPVEQISRPETKFIAFGDTGQSGQIEIVLSAYPLVSGPPWAINVRIAGYRPIETHASDMTPLK